MFQRLLAECAWHPYISIGRPIRSSMESPCVNVCVMDPASGLCAGCQRTMAEIAAWASLTASERRRIMAELGARRRQSASKEPAP